MKNSQYVNQVNIGINEMVRIEFSDFYNRDGVNTTNHVVTVCAFVDAAEMMAKTILQTIEAHREKQTNISSDKNFN